MNEIEIKNGDVIDMYEDTLVGRVAMAIALADCEWQGLPNPPIPWKETLARAAITEMIRNTSQQHVVGVDFGPKPAAVAIAQIEVDLCFEALPDFVLK